jgi:hypothetical protein
MGGSQKSSGLSRIVNLNPQCANSAAGFIMRRCLFRVSIEDSCPPIPIGRARFLVDRVNPFRILLMSLLPHGKQISPDKNVNFPCTTAAFTLPPEPVGFVVLCQLARRLSFICGFCSSSRTFAIGFPSDPSSRRHPCLWLVLLIVSIYDEHLLVLVQGTFTP